MARTLRTTSESRALFASRGKRQASRPKKSTELSARSRHDNPSLTTELNYLESVWAIEAGPTPEAQALIAAYRRECAGEE